MFPPNTAFTISETIEVESGLPEMAEVTEKTSYSDAFSFQFAYSHSSTVTVQDTITQTIGIDVPPFSNLTVSMMVASQVRFGRINTLQAFQSTQDDVPIPFVAQLYTTAYDWMARSDAPTEQQIVDILYASGFNGRILSYNPANNSLLIEADGVVNAALATNVVVQVTCTPIPGHEEQCPQQLPIQVPTPQGTEAQPQTHTAIREPEQNGPAKYMVRLPSKK